MIVFKKITKQTLKTFFKYWFFIIKYDLYANIYGTYYCKIDKKIVPSYRLSWNYYFALTNLSKNKAEMFCGFFSWAIQREREGEKRKGRGASSNGEKPINFNWEVFA